MTKTSTALMSLIAAIPGAFLAYLLVMAFLSHADKMGTTLNAVVGVGLLCGVATALIPVGTMLFGGPKGPAKPKKPKKKKGKKDADEEAGDSVVGLEEVGDDSGEYDDSSESLSGASDAYSDSDDSGELMDDFESSGSSDLMDPSNESGESEAMMDAYDDDMTGKHQVSDEWEVPDSDVSDEFEFDEALSDEFEFDDDEEK